MKNLLPPSKLPAARRDWTRGSIAGNLWSLAWPMLISNTLNALGPAVDMIWVGKLGSSAIAGVGVSGLAVMVMNALVTGFYTGTTAMIARFIGAKNEETANRAAQQAFAIGLVFSIIMALVGIFLAENIMVLLGMPPEVVREGAAYLRIQFAGIITMSALSVSQSIMQASGDSRNPLKISLGFRTLQIALCPALIFGWGFFPRLEVTGAALSNVITQGVGAGIALRILFSGRTRLRVTLRHFRFDGNLIWRTLKIGLPSSTTFVLITFTELMLVRFIAPFGAVAVAAHSLAIRIDQFIQSLTGGLGISAGILGGQNLGAGQPERASRTGWLAISMASGITLFCSIILWFEVESILRIFNATDPVLLDMAANFLRIQIVSYMVWGLVIVLTLFLNGIGDTLIPLITNVVTMLGIQLTLAYFLPQVTGLGVYGVRWAIVTGQMMRAIIYPLYFSSGRWKRKKV
jgi:putative MATE family efflux protein